MDTFSKRDIAITLTGEQWFALLARTFGKDLSKQGIQLYGEAIRAINAALLANK